jgi:hypothetical protein
MLSNFRFKRLLALAQIVFVFVTTIAAGQDSSSTLLRLQRSKADLNLETNVVHAQGMNGITYGKGGDVSTYPNSLSCLVVYNDGKYVIEKRDEATVGKPKIKSAQGTLGADDLQRLKGILEDENLRKIVSPKPPDMPNNATIREIESIDAEIDRGGTPQHLTTVRERLKMGASEFGGVTNGMDTYIDNSAPFQKALNPLMKWFDGLEKKSKSDLKDSKPQYCSPIGLG